MIIGVFDSGIGGKAVAKSLSIAFPDADIHEVSDKENVPYGNKDSDEITRLTLAAIQPLIESVCDVIVIACNSATAAAIDTLRSSYPDQIFIGLEPMVKPACTLSKSGVIAVCATPATLASARYKNLKETYAQSTLIVEPDCSTWATMIEGDQIDELIIKNTIADVIAQGADVIVLACTHYHWIREMIESAAGAKVTVLDPSNAIASRVKVVLESR